MRLRWFSSGRWRGPMLGAALSSVLAMGNVGCTGRVQESSLVDGGSQDSMSSLQDGDSEGGDTNVTADGGELLDCPVAKTEGGCEQRETVVRNPITAACCAYPSPCSAPSGWKVFANEDECNITCPEQREPFPDEMCFPEAVCAISPVNGMKCLIGDPCHTPIGWEWTDVSDCKN